VSAHFTNAADEIDAFTSGEIKPDFIVEVVLNWSKLHG